ncbi:Kinesin- protein 6 [Thoreauomyces humboldtii]|nr:Kinesin- protein 6 [Thoreauomyces humboldtii]
METLPLPPAAAGSSVHSPSPLPSSQPDNVSAAASTSATPAPPPPASEQQSSRLTNNNNNNNAPATIQIYARVRPARANSKLPIDPNRYWCNPASQDQDGSKPRIGFHVPKDQAAGMINNQRESYDFRFDRVFDRDVGQEEVFDVVAKPVVLSVMDGYNGTIFAYGQTGSGKTFTITGGAERYGDRGIIPRTLQFVFAQMQKDHDVRYEVSVSYLEIYNEVAYDLLDSTREAKKLEDLPKVSLQEDDGGNIHLRNLSCITAKDEEEALNLLFIGDTNRMIAETPSNPASSRSHCLFIVNITGRKEGEDTIRKSKLHLVDLAGSERVGRTGINGTLLKEAKYINLSLHYLEQVIIALHEKASGKRTHVPYRNSMMTSVLRDSLGGNCRTTMVATVAVEDVLIDESISTCRFAQRVALVSNNAQLNEELDPRLQIARLKREVARLKVELAIARGETGDDAGEELPEYEKERVKDAVMDYLRDGGKDAALLFADARKIGEAFRLLKVMTKQTASSVSNHSVPGTVLKTASALPAAEDGPAAMDSDENGSELERLRRLIAHRDNEINILVEMVNKLRSGEEVDKRPLKALPPEIRSAVSMPSLSGPSATAAANTKSVSLSSLPTTSTTTTGAPAPGFGGSTARLAASVPQLTSEKAKAFEIFKSGYPSGSWIEGQKTLLKGKYGDAKALGEKAHQLRTDMSEFGCVVVSRSRLNYLSGSMLLNVGTQQIS